MKKPMGKRMQQRTLEGESHLEAVLNILSKDQGKDAIVQGDRRVTRAEAERLLWRLANALRTRGLGNGDGVAVFIGNSPEGLLLCFAIHLAGCRLVFVPPEPGDGELQGFLREAEVEALVCDARYERALPLARAVQVKHVLSLGSSVASDLLADPVPDARWPISKEHLHTVLYTGGTTGRPKLVTHDHQSYYAVRAAHAALSPFAESKTLLNTLMTHSSGHLGCMLAMTTGTTVIMLEGAQFDAGEAIATIRREGVQTTTLLPALLYQVLDHPDCAREGFPSLEKLLYTGAPTNPARVRQAIERFGPLLSQRYAQTEMWELTLLAAADHDPKRPQTLRSCGRAAPGVRLEIRDDDGNPLRNGQVGEIYAQGPAMMAGYWNAPELTRAAIRDGWLRTGDRGYLDDDGFLYLVDRSKDIIVVPSAQNIYSRLLDDFAGALPGVTQAATVGVLDEKRDEVVHLFLATTGTALSDDEIRKLVIAELGDSYAPRYISRVSALPLTPIGKVDKKALRIVAQQH